MNPITEIHSLIVQFPVILWAGAAALSLAAVAAGVRRRCPAVVFHRHRGDRIWRSFS